MSDSSASQCGHCGEPYDRQMRGVTGRFHMAVINSSDRHGLLKIAGHWRTGTLPADGRFVSGNSHFRAEVVLPSDGPARERGQMALTVIDGTPPETDACIWGDDEVPLVVVRRVQAFNHPREFGWVLRRRANGRRK